MEETPRYEYFTDAEFERLQAVVDKLEEAARPHVEALRTIAIERLVPEVEPDLGYVVLRNWGQFMGRQIYEDQDLVKPLRTGNQSPGIPS